MKKILSILVSMAITAAVLIGCGKADSYADGAGTISTDGSTSMEKVIGALGELCYNRYVTKKEDKRHQKCYDVNNHKNT